MATTPVPNTISTNVPRNSAISSAMKEDFAVVVISAFQLAFRPRSSLTRLNHARRFFAGLGGGVLAPAQNDAGFPCKLPPADNSCLTFPPTHVKYTNIYSFLLIYMHHD